MQEAKTKTKMNTKTLIVDFDRPGDAWFDQEMQNLGFAPAQPSDSDWAHQFNWNPNYSREEAREKIRQIVSRRNDSVDSTYKLLEPIIGFRS